MEGREGDEKVAIIVLVLAGKERKQTKESMERLRGKGTKRQIVRDANCFLICSAGAFYFLGFYGPCV